MTNFFEQGSLFCGFLLLENLFLAQMLSGNDCSTDHPVIGPSGDKVDLKAKKGAVEERL